MSNTYPRTLRLLNRFDFQKVYRNGRRFPHYQFTAIVKINGQSHPRLGISLSKKTVSAATKRNRIKRIIRESFRIQQNELKGFDIIITVTKNILATDTNFITSLNKQWKKLALQQSPS